LAGRSRRTCSTRWRSARHALSTAWTWIWPSSCSSIRRPPSSPASSRCRGVSERRKRARQPASFRTGCRWTGRVHDCNRSATLDVLSAADPGGYASLQWLTLKGYIW